MAPPTLETVPAELFANEVEVIVTVPEPAINRAPPPACPPAVPGTPVALLFKNVEGATVRFPAPELLKGMPPPIAPELGSPPAVSFENTQFWILRLPPPPYEIPPPFLPMLAAPLVVEL